MNKICKTITKKQQDFLANLAKLSIEASLGGENTVSFRILFGPCCDSFINDFMIKFGTIHLSEIKCCQYNDAIEFIAEWFPDDILMDISVQLENDFEDFRYRYVEEMPQDSPAYKQLMEDFINAVCSGAEGSDED